MSVVVFSMSALLLLAMAVPGFAMHRRFVMRLRNEHPDTWEALGRPSLVFYGSMENARKVHTFIRDSEFESLSDDVFVRFCRRYRVYTDVYSTTFTVMWVSCFAVAIGLGYR